MPYKESSDRSDSEIVFNVEMLNEIRHEVEIEPVIHIPPVAKIS